MHTALFTPIDAIGTAFSSPLGCLIAAIVLAALVLVIARRPAPGNDAIGDTSRDELRPYAAEHRGLAVAALMVLVVFLGEFIVRGHLVPGISLPWWRFAIPLIVATIGLAVVAALITTRGMPHVTEPMSPTPRRGWRSFSSPRALTGAGVAILLLIITTVGAGSVSSTDDDGRYAMLAIPVPNAPHVDPLRFSFYGWAYGIPVLFGLTAVALATGVVLHLNAARRFQRTQTIATETVARRRTAQASVALLTAAVLASLAEAWRQIGGVGSPSSLTVMGDAGDVTYETPWRFAELAAALRWCAPALEVVALAILVVLIVSGVRAQRGPRMTAAGRSSRSGSIG